MCQQFYDTELNNFNEHKISPFIVRKNNILHILHSYMYINDIL